MGISPRGLAKQKAKVIAVYTKENLLARIEFDKVSKKPMAKAPAKKNAQMVAGSAILELYYAEEKSKRLALRMKNLEHMVGVIKEQLELSQSRLKDTEEEREEFARYVDEIYTELESMRLEATQEDVQ